MASSTTHTGASPLASRFALIVGAAFLAVGVLGFVPGITQDLGDITFATHDSGAELLGLFQVSVLHNLVHLLFGALGLWASRRPEIARTYLFAGGATYLLLTLYGTVIDRASGANFVPVNTADNWLHLALGLGMIGLGALASDRNRGHAGAST